MAIHKRITSRKLIIYLGILILCLLTGADDISGYWQPSNTSTPMIQSGNGQDDGGDHNIKAIYNHPAWREAIDVAQQLPFSKACFEEIKWQENTIYLGSSQNRAPPSFS